MFTLFLYTGQELDSFIANVPDHLLVFVNGEHTEARSKFIDVIGKEPELMGYTYLESDSKKSAWEKAITVDESLSDLSFDVAMSLDETIVLE